jgi:quercetin dioxygenase-like cupin family protein
MRRFGREHRRRRAGADPARRGRVMLELRVVHLKPGRAARTLIGPQQELLYVASGTGVLRLGGETHGLEPDVAALLLPEDTYELEAAEDLTVVSVSAPAGEQSQRDRVTVRLADCEEHRADEHRTFRVLFQTNVTQFVGVVQPSRAPDHSHPYDEVGYILDGQGFAHVGGESTPIAAGSQFHLRPGEVHCIENSGPEPMRILGVFYPSGSPAQRLDS